MAVIGAALVTAAGGWLASINDACAPVCDPVSDEFEAAQREPLTGVWWRHAPGVTGDPVRFYYFHGDGTGLYRYGQVGHTYTHSFDYRIGADDRLRLVFRKTGQAHDVQFDLSPGDGRDWLTLHDDPREPAPVRYFRLADREAPRDVAAAADLGPAPAGHMWLDLQRYATGGQGFYFYQLRPAGIDGRGVGWFHRGDFDDWSTESLSYRIVDDPPQLELHFELTDTTVTTPMTLEGTGTDRTLTLQADPRDFGQQHRYRDAGRSFGGLGGTSLGVVPPDMSVALMSVGATLGAAATPR